MPEHWVGLKRVGLLPGGAPKFVQRSMVTGVRCQHTPDAIFDIFTGASSRRRTWDRTLRYHGTLDRLPAFEGGKPLGRTDGYEHIATGDPVFVTDGWIGN